MNYIKYSKSILHATELTTKACLEATRKIHKEMGFEVSHEQYLIMETIVTIPGAIQTVIAKEILMQCSYVCKLLSQLEEKGYIERKQAIRGKKQIIYENYLTKKGEKVYKEIQNYYASLTPKFENAYKDVCKSLAKEHSNPIYEKIDMEVISEILSGLTDKIIKGQNLKF